MGHVVLQRGMDNDQTTEDKQLRRSLENKESRDRAVARRVRQDEASRKDHAEASQARIPMLALAVAQKRHSSCRGVLGLLPVTGDRLNFECCDCHEIVSVSTFEACV